MRQLAAELTPFGYAVTEGCGVDEPDTGGFEEAMARTAEADVCVAVLGDRAGLFGRGTSGEGCDVTDLRLPGVQGELLDSLVATGVPVVLVLLTGRPYALGRWDGRLGAVVQAFFPGEEGGPAVAGVLSGRVNPSGRLPVSVPRVPGGQPWTYLQPPLGLAGEVSNLDPTPLYAFGHGRSYTEFVWEDVEGSAPRTTTDGSYDLAVTVRNTGDRAGAEVVQLYLHDPVASVTRPDVRLIGYQRLELEPGESRRVTFRFHADLSAFTDRRGRRIVETGGPGATAVGVERGRPAHGPAPSHRSGAGGGPGPPTALRDGGVVGSAVTPPTRTATGAPPGSPTPRPAPAVRAARRRRARPTR